MNAYKYADDGQLTGNTRVDKPTLIMADRYIIEQGLLYRIDMPRQKKLARMKPLVKRLCVPKRFRHDIIRHVHNHYGHYAAVTLYHALSTRYFWKSLFKDVHDFCRTCETCQRTKINLSHRQYKRNRCAMLITRRSCRLSLPLRTPLNATFIILLLFHVLQTQKRVILAHLYQLLLLLLLLLLL